MPYALAWRLLCSKGMGAQVLSASCRAAVSRAHAHRPLGERDAHGLVREKRGELSSLDAACCACTPRASHEAAPIPSGAYFGTRSHGMPSVMDAPELMEYVETHAFTIETRERPQPPAAPASPRRRSACAASWSRGRARASARARTSRSSVRCRRRSAPRSRRRTTRTSASCARSRSP